MKVLLLLLAAMTANAAVKNEAWVRTRIIREALKQSEAMTPDWQPEQRDCAGLVRHVFQKAIGQRDGLWLDRKQKHQHFVGAGELIANNFRLLGRDPDRLELQTGDVLVYQRAGVLPDDAWHLMILLNPPQGAPGKELVVYHNGDKANGEVRKLWLEDLSLQDSGQWRAKPSNKNFLGVYRWKNFE